MAINPKVNMIVTPGVGNIRSQSEQLYPTRAFTSSSGGPIRCASGLQRYAGKPRNGQSAALPGMIDTVLTRAFGIGHHWLHVIFEEARE